MLVEKPDLRSAFEEGALRLASDIVQAIQTATLKQLTVAAGVAPFEREAALLAVESMSPAHLLQGEDQQFAHRAQDCLEALAAAGLCPRGALPFDKHAREFLSQTYGLTNDQADLLVEYARCGFPEQVEFSKHLGIPNSVLVKRVSRIKVRLGVTTLPQVARLMTVLSLIGLGAIPPRLLKPG